MDRRTVTLIEYPDLVQGTEEWHAARRGIVTASTVGRLLSVTKPGAQEYECPECAAPAGEPCISKRGGAVIKTLHSERATVAADNAATALAIVKPATGDDARNLTLLLTSERIAGWTEPTFISADMERGHRDEPIARDLYSEHYAQATEVGFMRLEMRGYTLGYSPDGTVGDGGLIEVKSRRPKSHLATILADAVPVENMAQLMCGLLVSGRKWIDYISICTGLPLWVKRVYPDPVWFDAIVQAVVLFELNAAHMIRTYTARTTGLPMTERILDLEEMIL